MMAAGGMCTGTFTDLEIKMREQWNETEYWIKNGFRFVPIDQPQPSQVAEMMKNCRKTCGEALKHVPFDDLPEVVRAFGGYDDVAVDNFGRPLQICSLKEGFIPRAAERALGIFGSGYYQSRVVPGLHPVGFEKVKIPKDIYARYGNVSKEKILLWVMVGWVGTG